MRLDTVIDLFNLKEVRNENDFPEKIIDGQRSVFAKKESVRSTEFYAATSSGFSREKLVFVILTLEYDSQEFVEYNSRTYQIIRTYEKGKFIELICQAYQERP